MIRYTDIVLELLLSWYIYFILYPRFNLAHEQKSTADKVTKSLISFEWNIHEINSISLKYTWKCLRLCFLEKYFHNCYSIQKEIQRRWFHQRSYSVTVAYSNNLIDNLIQDTGHITVVIFHNLATIGCSFVKCQGNHIHLALPCRAWINLISAWMSNHMASKVCDEITYPFWNFKGCTIEVWERMINFIPHFIMDVIAYPCWDQS